MSAPKWIPTDAELDAIARDLPPHAPTVDAAEQIRTRVLAGAAAALPRRSSRTWLYVVGGAIAAAAALVIWLALPGSPSTPPDPLIVVIDGARYEHVSDWPDYQLRVHEGQLSITVTRATDRFRVIASDVEVEVRTARFLVEAQHDQLELVRVETGEAVVRVVGAPAVTVLAGGEWRPVRTAQIETTTITPPVVVEPAKPAPPKPTAKPHTPKPAAAKAEAPKPEAPKPEPPKPEPPKPEPPNPEPPKPETPASPGELAFRKGWSDLRAGDARSATSSFATACTQLRSEALGEDACYWLGVAAKRAGNAALARDALAKFLAAFPSSARAGEASALLGWLHYDAGELDAAQRRFEQAAEDRAPTVRDSARRGLTAIDRKRAK